MLDVAHLPFVHRGTIGRSLSKQSVLQNIEPTDYGFELRWHLSDEPPQTDPFGPETRDGRAWLQWWQPSASVLDLPNPMGEYRQRLTPPAHARRPIEPHRGWAVPIRTLCSPASGAGSGVRPTSIEGAPDEPEPTRVARIDPPPPDRLPGLSAQRRPVGHRRPPA
jgi:hypothetical protein